MLRVLDLFSCVGCHAVGMHRAGHQTVQFVEFNPARSRVLAAQFPETPIHDDVRTFDGSSVRADIAFGGPPLPADKCCFRYSRISIRRKPLAANAQDRRRS